MSIILENQNVKAGVRYQDGGLDIFFEDDPSYVRSETVLLDIESRSIGIIFQNAYHYIGSIPGELGIEEMEHLFKIKARLLGLGAGGKPIALHAPIKIVALAQGEGQLN
ncbi:MAG: hypothetical protein WC989_03405 [Micavibrio sp.]